MSIITSDIELVISDLKESKIAAIPTETVYGLAADAENEKAIKKVYRMKNRPLNHPLIMHVAEDWDLKQWVSEIPDYAYRLMELFWPGPLTIVFHLKKGSINPLVTGGQSTIALRCPNHPLAQTLLKRLNFPLVAPSANPFGKISPTTALHVQQSFKNEELHILDGGRCQVGIESTILAAIAEDGYEILRQGIIDEAKIKSELNTKKLEEDSQIRVPGKLASHYQPEKPMYCFTDSAALENFCKQSKCSVYVLSFAKLSPIDSSLHYQFPHSVEQVAFELYYQLRRADQSIAKLIVVELPPNQEQWQAIRERLLKAATKKL